MSGPVVIVAGALANKPLNGGEAWVRLSWIRGLARLGCDVWFVEEIADAICTDGELRSSPFVSSLNRRWFRGLVECFGLAGRASLICDTGEVEGVPLATLRDVADDAALLVNISGHLRVPSLRAAVRRRVYVDIDPGFTQLWHAAGDRGIRLAGHDRYFTIGENVGVPGCQIPVDDLGWRTVRQPVVLDDWPAVVATRPAEPVFTTVATWRGPFGPIELDGRRFGLKVHEFRKFFTLPERVAARFEAALAIHPAEVADLARLSVHRWHLVEPRDVAGTPDAFRAYVAGSTAEFSVAQGMYVDTWSGWFSDRTTRYLASGRPALVQDTGFSRNLPVGEGLVPFRTLDEAAAGAEAILENYEAHADAARAVAELCFDSDVVLTRFLEECDAA
jgi:hypothetical protein